MKPDKLRQGHGGPRLTKGAFGRAFQDAIDDIYILPEQAEKVVLTATDVQSIAARVQGFVAARLRQPSSRFHVTANVDFVRNTLTVFAADRDTLFNDNRVLDFKSLRVDLVEGGA